MFLSLFIILFFGVIGGYIFEKIHLPKLIWYLILGISFGLLTIESTIKQYISFSSLLGIIFISIIINRNNMVEAKQIENKYKSFMKRFWNIII